MRLVFCCAFFKKFQKFDINLRHKLHFFKKIISQFQNFFITKYAKIKGLATNSIH